jgi:hypothetical protein
LAALLLLLTNIETWRALGGDEGSAFLDMIIRMGGDPFAKRRLMWFGSPTILLTFVLTQDLAGHLVDAVDAPCVDGQRIDIGWDGRSACMRWRRLPGGCSVSRSECGPSRPG